MQRLIHLSDLHFGRNDEGLSRKFLSTLHELQPTAVAISGDLTQRARPPQFAAAQKFLRAIKVPVIVVPGNHDIPLFNVFARFLAPYANYKNYISTNLEPILSLENLLVVGLNSTNRKKATEASLRNTSIKQVALALSKAASSVKRIILSHHPLEEIKQASPEFQKIIDTGFDAYLCGHGHRSIVELRSFENGRQFVYAQAGTAFSTRLRGEANSWNLFEIAGQNITAKVFKYDENNKNFIEEKGMGCILTHF